MARGALFGGGVARTGGGGEEAGSEERAVEHRCVLEMVGEAVQNSRRRPAPTHQFAEMKSNCIRGTRMDIRTQKAPKRDVKCGHSRGCPPEQAPPHRGVLRGAKATE